MECDKLRKHLHIIHSLNFLFSLLSLVSLEFDDDVFTIAQIVLTGERILYNK